MNITEIEAIERMTLWEYNLRMKAHNLSMVDKEYEIHRAAWENREINLAKKGNKNKSRYVYTDWKSFFDYEERVAKMNGEEPKTDSIADRLRQYERDKRDGQL